MQARFDVLILASRGLAEVCYREVERLIEILPHGTFEELELDFGGVTCSTNTMGIIYLNLFLRTASRVLIRLIDGVKVTDEEALRQQVAKARIHLDFMNINQTFMVDASSTNTEGLSGQYLALVVKDGLCDAFREATGGKRPNVEKVTPDIRVFAKVESGRLWLSLDTSGRPLHQRGYRKQTDHEAPLKEQLAAGLLALAGWQDFCFELKKGNFEKFFFEREVVSLNDESKRKIPARIPFSGFFCDPMCGTGTLAIEAALMLKHRFIRKNWEDFAMRGLAPFAREKRIFEECVEKLNSLELADAQVIELLREYRKKNFSAEANADGKAADLPPCIASDKDPAACEETRLGAARAGVDGLIKILQKDFFTETKDVAAPLPGTLTIMNPPYDKRLAADPANDYKLIGDALKCAFADCMGWVVSANAVGMKSVGLRPTRNLIVYNGALEAKFCQYIVYGKRQ